MGLADDISDGIKDVVEALRYIILIGIVIIILWYVATWYFDNREIVQEDISKLCGLRDEFNKIFDQIESISTENFDDNGLRIYWDLINGKEISECDAWYFYQQLDENNRKKINLKDLVCNLNDCLAK